MSIKKINKDAFGNVVANIIAGDNDVVGVQAKADKFAFGPLDSADDLRLDYDVTLLPPKKYFQPPVETLMTYKVGGEYQSEISDRKLVLIGVHPYDMIAINQMDELFSQDEFDTHY
ncbi:MAG: Ni/Fe hydrogenase subunit beta, partial [Planctomycetes bacterium]|nr:Ni/Fe hydrogenase subunit beta [Planctomycetota bacterium]